MGEDVGKGITERRGDEVGEPDGGSGRIEKRGGEGRNGRRRGSEVG